MEKKWCGLPESVVCTREDEKGKYNIVDGFFLNYDYTGDSGYCQIAKVYVEKNGKHEVEFLNNRFSSDVIVQKVIKETMEMQDRGLEFLGKRVKTNDNNGLCCEYHQITGTIGDYHEEKTLKNNNILGETIKCYYVLFDNIEPKPTNNLCKGLWLEKKYFDFIDENEG